MPRRNSEEIEDLVASHLARILVSVPDTNAALHAMVQRDLSAPVARILQDRLAEDPRWDSRRYWIDDILVDACSIDGSGRLDVSGHVVFGEGHTTRQWLAPSAVSAWLTPREHLAYRLRFLDEREEPHEYPKSPRLSGEPYWRFIFERNAA